MEIITKLYRFKISIFKIRDTIGWAILILMIAVVMSIVGAVIFVYT